MYGFLRHQQSKQLAKPLSWHFRQAGLKKPEVSAENFRAQEYETFVELLNAHTIVDEKALIDSALQAGVKGRSAKALANYCSIYQKDLLNSMDKSLNESWAEELSNEDLSSEIKVLQDRMNILLKRRKALITKQEDFQSKIIKTQLIPVQEELFAKSRENAIHNIGADDKKHDTSEVVDKTMKSIPPVDLDKCFRKRRGTGYNLVWEAIMSLRGPKQISSWSAVLDKVKITRVLGIKFYTFKPDDLHALSDILLICEHLEELALGFMKSYLVGWREVFSLPTKHFSQLKSLQKLSIGFYDRFGRPNFDGAFTTILRAVTAEPMKEISISNVDITPVLADILKFRNLECIVLNMNGQTGNSTMLSFVGGLSRMKNLKDLTLIETSIGCAGAKTLAGVLPELMNLRTLDLEGNNIGCPGIKILAGAFAGLKYLYRVELLRNKIGNPGLKTLAGVVPEMKSLEILNLSHNKISDGGARALAAVLPKLKLKPTKESMTFSIFHGNSISDDLLHVMKP